MSFFLTIENFISFQFAINPYTKMNIYNYSRHAILHYQTFNFQYTVIYDHCKEIIEASGIEKINH